MTFDPDRVEKLSAEEFRRFGIACCRRLGVERADKRLAKALRTLVRSLGPPPDEKLRRDAYNAANSAYRELRRGDPVSKAVACTLVCACWVTPIPNLIGNFEAALEQGEGLGRAEVRQIEADLFRALGLP